jgi:hypothetical protein
MSHLSYFLANDDEAKHQAHDQTSQQDHGWNPSQQVHRKYSLLKQLFLGGSFSAGRWFGDIQ